MFSPATFQIAVKLLPVSRFLPQFRVDTRHFPREDGVYVDSEAMLYVVYECVGRWTDGNFSTSTTEVIRPSTDKRWL